jgi:hypothetical protein
MNKGLKLSMLSAVIATTGLFAVMPAVNAGWGGEHGHCNRSEMRGEPRIMNGRRSGSAMNRNLDLTAEEAKTLVSARLIMRGNDRLKVGQVTEKDASTYLVDIVTVDNSLVRQMEVDRNNGLPHKFGRSRY